MAKAKARPVFFSSPAALRAWFAEHAATADVLQVGFYKKHTGKASLTWQESVDEALCVGWIDGVRHRIDDDRFTNRFTPRRTGSHWSRINIARVQALIAEGRMQPAGLAAFEARRPHRIGRTSYEERPSEFPAGHARAFRKHKAAWAWFSAQPPGYRRTAIWYVVSAVRPETQAKRLATVIEASAAGRRIA